MALGKAAAFATGLLGFVIGYTTSELRLATGTREHAKRPSLDERIAALPQEPDSKPGKYALLVCGRNEARFKADTSLGYRVLQQQGYSAEHIFVLDYDAEAYLYPSDGKCTKANVGKVLAYLAKVDDEKDSVVLFYADHGNRNFDSRENKTVSTLSLADGDWYEREVKQATDALSSRVIVVVDACYSGGIAQRVAKENVAALSASGATEKGYSNPDAAWSSFSGQFFLAHEDYAADTDKDGRTSLAEAFSYARATHYFSKNKKCTPQAYGKLDRGLGW